jgi:hypothetical protein
MFLLKLPFDLGDLLLTPPWPGLPPAARAALTAAVCLLPLALILWLYRSELRLVSRLTAGALLSLRLAVLVLILLLVCLQPVYARTRTHTLPGRVLVAVDCSESMHVADPQRSPADKLRLARALRLAEGLCPDELLAGWIADYEQHGGPRWLRPDEKPGDAARRSELEAQRRKLHDEVCARVDRLTRAEEARRVLSDDGIRLLSALAAAGHTVELVGFHRDAWQVPADRFAELFDVPAGGKDDKAGVDAGYTDLRLPLARTEERLAAVGQGEVLGVVLLSDGQHNTGPSPAEAARKLGERHLPVYPVALGDRRPPPDAALVAVAAPPAVFKDVEVPVEVRFKVAGLPAQDVRVELRRTGKDGKLLASRTVRHDGKDRSYAETFPVLMDEAGTVGLEASVRPLPPGTRETRTDNNTRSTSIIVADDKARVLLIDGEARWEYHYLAAALRRDPTVQLETVVFDQPRLDRSRSPEELRAMGCPAERLPAGADALTSFDCIIVGDVSPAQLPPADRARLEKYVADRGGTLVVVAGKRSMPLAFAEAEDAGEPDPLRKLLPVERPGVAASGDGFPVTLTREGRETKFMEMDPDPARSEAVWAGLQRHHWGVFGRAKPGATVLATPGPSAPGKGGREDALIAWQPYGFGRVLFVGLDSTWRWRFKVGDLYHHTFWGAAVRWAASDKPLMAGNEYVRFGTPQPVFAPEDEVRISARFSERLGPVKPDLIAGARILWTDGGPGKERQVALVPLARREAQPRVLEGRIAGLPPGEYEVELNIPDLADKLRPAAPAPGRPSPPMRARFRVRPPQGPELTDLETRWPLLEEIAARSGGKVFAADEAAGLVDLLTRKAISHVEHHEQKLWQWWAVLVVVVGLLSLEWAGRKLAGLP